MRNNYTTGRSGMCRSYTEIMAANDEARVARAIRTDNAEPLPEVSGLGDYYVVTLALVILERTPKAFLVARNHDTAGGEIYLPQSQVTVVDSLVPGPYRAGMHRKLQLVTMPLWLYRKIRAAGVL